VLQQLGVDGLVPESSLRDAIAKYKLHDVTAGTSGSAGGES
jgi:pyruvate dehydrogenase E1 component